MEHFTIIFHSGMGYGRDISCFLTKKEARALHAIGNLFITKAIKQTINKQQTTNTRSAP
jgi:hypothetical protein